MEPYYNAVKSPELAGVIAFRLSIVEASDGPNSLDKQPLWTKKMARRPTNVKIRAYIFQCQDLPAADEEGTSDPLVSCFSSIQEEDDVSKIKCETDVIMENCDPMFYEVVELSVDTIKNEDYPPFLFDVYDLDQNIFSKSRDYIGRAIVNVDKESDDPNCFEVTEENDKENLKPPVPKWYPIRYSQDSPVAGKILMSFIECRDDDFKWKTPLEDVRMMGLNDDSAIVRFDEYRVELNVLGLRDLVSPGLLPVKKAYIDFLLKSMVPPMAAHALDKISTTPKATGENPTINTVVSFEIPMPKDPLFAPSMSCRVYDKVFKGLSG